MRLISYHIENYGKLSNIDGEFPDGLTCVCEQNGYGKSTLASFLKAMFYGLPSYTAASKTFNDRQRYYPFSGGKFGGSLNFEYGGKEYRIERVFDKKSTSKDTYRVLHGGVDYDGFGEELGKTVFGVDEEAFLRTVFITADKVEIGATHSINEKLGGAVEGDGGFAPAYKALEDAKKSLKAARGGGGKINVEKQRIDELTVAIKNLKDMDESLSREYALREELTVELADLEQELARASEQGVVAQKWKNYDDKAQEYAEKKARLNAYQARYPLGFPTSEERQALQRQWQENNRLHGQLQASAFSPQSEARLRRLDAQFENGAPMSADIDAIRVQVSGFAERKVQKRELQRILDEDAHQELKSRFADGVPSEAELNAYSKRVEVYRQYEQRLKEQMEGLLRRDVKPAKKKNAPSVALLALGALLLCGGAGLFFAQQALGIALMLVGGVGLAAGLVLRAVKPTMPPTNTDSIAALRAEMDPIADELYAFAQAYGYYSEMGAVHTFASLCEGVTRYREVVEREASMRERIVYLDERIRKESEDYYDYLKRYGVTEPSLEAGLDKLSQELREYQRLREEKSNAVAARLELAERIKEGEAAIEGLLGKYGLDASVGTMDGLNRLNADIRACEGLTEELKRLHGELAEYKEKNGLSERPSEGADTAALNAVTSQRRKALADCDRRIADTERQVEGLPELDNALLVARERLELLNDKYALIEDTMSALSDAEQALKDKYIKPIRDRFSVYAEALEKALDEKVSMTKDLEVVFERGGESRSEKHLSAGERSLCALCLRLALVDNMYEGELPFIIMDDPFVHLDAAHMHRAKSLLNTLAASKQIIYFCCHDSRRV